MGFSIAMPVGPIGLLCMRNSLTRGMSYGFVSGMGAALADAIFGLIASLGVTAIGVWMSEYQFLLQLVGGIFLCVLGATIFFEKPKEADTKGMSGGYFFVFLSTFFLTIINPLTILSFAGIYATLAGDLPSQHWMFPLILTLGVFVGSSLWWLILSTSASLFKNKITTKMRQGINRISGTIIFLFGIIALFIDL